MHYLFGRSGFPNRKGKIQTIVIVQFFAAKVAEKVLE